MNLLLVSRAKNEYYSGSQLISITYYLINDFASFYRPALSILPHLFVQPAGGLSIEVVILHSLSVQWLSGRALLLDTQ